MRPQPKKIYSKIAFTLQKIPFVIRDPTIRLYIYGGHVGPPSWILTFFVQLIRTRNEMFDPKNLMLDTKITSLCLIVLKL